MTSARAKVVRHVYRRAVQDLVRTHDRQLVVWYENGVLKLDGFG